MLIILLQRPTAYLRIWLEFGSPDMAQEFTNNSIEINKHEPAAAHDDPAYGKVPYRAMSRSGRSLTWFILLLVRVFLRQEWSTPYVPISKLLVTLKCSVVRTGLPNLTSQ